MSKSKSKITSKLTDIESEHLQLYIEKENEIVLLILVILLQIICCVI